MNAADIVDIAYEDAVKDATRILFGELVNDDHKGWHVSAERRFIDSLKAAAAVRDRAKVLIEEVK